MYTYTCTYTLTNTYMSTHHPLHTIHTSAVCCLLCVAHYIQSTYPLYIAHCTLSDIGSVHCTLHIHPSSTIHCILCMSTAHYTWYVIRVPIGRHSSVQISYLPCTHHISCRYHICYVHTSYSVYRCYI